MANTTPFLEIQKEFLIRYEKADKKKKDKDDILYIIKDNNQCDCLKPNEYYISGVWLDGKFNGKCTKVYEDGDTYIGDMRYNVFHGFGEYIWGVNSQWYKDIYKGMWKGGRRHYWGVYKFANGNSYQGEWQDGRRTGLGRFRFRDSDQYIGQFVNNTFHGIGYYLFKNGDAHMGTFQNDKFSGKGAYWYRSGPKFIGGWENDDRNGFGVFVDNENNIFSRYYLRGKMVHSITHKKETMKDKDDNELTKLKSEITRLKSEITKLEVSKKKMVMMVSDMITLQKNKDKLYILLQLVGFNEDDYLNLRLDGITYKNIGERDLSKHIKNKETIKKIKEIRKLL